MILMDEGTTSEELAYATGISSGSLTIPLANRGLEGSAAANHNSTFSVKGPFTAGMWNNVIQSLQNVLVKSTGALDTTKVVDKTTAQTLTNKTMDYNSNTFQNFPTSSTDGWQSSSDTWTYVSASSFKITGADRTTIFTPGTRLKFTQTTVKYAVVISSSFSTDTTVTIAVNTDYTIANAAITVPFYSYAVNPQGYPDWFNDTTGFAIKFGGSSAANTTVSKCKYKITGKSFEGIAHYAFTGAPGSGALTMLPAKKPLTSDEIVGVVRYWNLSTRTFLYVDNDGTTLTIYSPTGTQMSDTSPSTIANGHDLEVRLNYDYA